MQERSDRSDEHVDDLPVKHDRMLGEKKLGLTPRGRPPLPLSEEGCREISQRRMEARRFPVVLM